MIRAAASSRLALAAARLLAGRRPPARQEGTGVTRGQVHADFAAGKLTAKEAADAVMALRPRPSRMVRVISVVAHVAPYVLAAVGWGLVFFGRNGR